MTPIHKCSNCGLTGHKLWYDYPAPYDQKTPPLRCAKCVEEITGERFDVYRETVGGVGSVHLKWWAPALFAEDGTFYRSWAETNESCRRWHELPTFVDPQREIEWLRAVSSIWFRRLEAYSKWEVEVCRSRK